MGTASDAEPLQGSCVISCEVLFLPQIFTLFLPPCHYHHPPAVPQNFTGQPSLSPANIIVNSDAAITFTMKFTTELPAAAGHVSLFSSTGHINPELHLKDMQQSVTRRSHSAPAAAGVTSVSPRGSSYTAILQGAALRNLSNSPGVLHFTAVLGADDQPTGITAELQLLTGEQSRFWLFGICLQLFQLPFLQACMLHRILQASQGSC